MAQIKAVGFRSGLRMIDPADRAGLSACSVSDGNAPPGVTSRVIKVPKAKGHIAADRSRCTGCPGRFVQVTFEEKIREEV
jgi:hypothetical protein